MILTIRKLITLLASSIGPQSYQETAEVKSKEGIKVDDDITKDKKLCPDLKAKTEPIVLDGIDNLNKALQLRPDYDDAMAYMNLLYRRKGDLQCGDEGARQADLKTADEWVDKTLAVKKAKADKGARCARHHHGPTEPVSFVS